LRRAYLEYANRGMNGVHDMGGMDGFGPVVEPGGEIVYAERWESRVFAIHMVEELERLGAGPGARAVREEMAAADYLAASYYERWLFSVERRLERSGAIAPGEVDDMVRRLEEGEPAPTHHDAAMTERIVAEMATVHPIARTPDTVRFAPGERVRVKRMDPAGHTRCPRYIRGVVGVVETVRGADRLPDRATYGLEAPPEPVYSVAFASRDLWGPSEEGLWTVALDLWESYLEAP
jgi:nitrile hydratase beta subunit